MTVVVEFCGLPGSGKTTLAGLVATELAERELSGQIADAELSAAVSRSRRLRHKATAVAWQSAGHPLRTAGSARLIAASRQDSARDAVAGLVQWLAVQQAVAVARRGAGVQLFEEGVVQTLWTIGLRASRDVIRHLGESVPAPFRPDLLVVVEASVDVVRDRLAARPSRHSRTQRLYREAQTEELRRGSMLLDSITTWAFAETQVVCNDGRRELGTIAGQVADRVSRIIGPPTRR